MAFSRRKLLSASIQVTSAAAAVNVLGGGAGTASAAEAGKGNGVHHPRPTGLWAEFAANPYAHPQIGRAHV